MPSDALSASTASVPRPPPPPACQPWPDALAPALFALLVLPTSDARALFALLVLPTSDARAVPTMPAIAAATAPDTRLDSPNVRRDM